MRPEKNLRQNTICLGKQIYAKKSIIKSKLNFRQISIRSMLYTKIHNFYQIPSIIPCKYFLEFLHKKSVNIRHKINLRQNTVGQEQQIYASKENFTQPLVVMVETFRRSALCPGKQNSCHRKAPGENSTKKDSLGEINRCLASARRGSGRIAN